MRIDGGNVNAEIQIKQTVKDEIHSSVETWETVQTLTGFLDFISGETKHGTYYAKIEESTHIFLADYEPLDERISSENSRLVINGKIYDCTMIDNPMGLNYHWEIYLAYTGGV